MPSMNNCWRPKRILTPMHHKPTRLIWRKHMDVAHQNRACCSRLLQPITTNYCSKVSTTPQEHISATNKRRKEQQRFRILTSNPSSSRAKASSNVAYRSRSTPGSCPTVCQLSACSIARSIQPLRCWSLMLSITWLDIWLHPLTILSLRTPWRRCISNSPKNQE